MPAPNSRLLSVSAFSVSADFNEPYYRSYISTDLGSIAEEAGLVCGTKVCIYYGWQIRESVSFE